MKYRVHFRAFADCAVEIETDATDEGEIIEAAYEEVPSGLCYRCYLGEWEPAETDPVEVIE